MSGLLSVFSINEKFQKIHSITVLRRSDLHYSCDVSSLINVLSAMMLSVCVTEEFRRFCNNQVFNLVWYFLTKIGTELEPWKNLVTKEKRKNSFRGPNHKPNRCTSARQGKLFLRPPTSAVKRLLGAQLRSDYFLRQLQNDQKSKKNTFSRQDSIWKKKREMKTKQSEETQSFTNADIECGNKYDFIMKNVSTVQSNRAVFWHVPAGTLQLIAYSNIFQFSCIFKQINTFI